VARILIVDDEPDLRLTLREDLQRQGYDVGEASDGAQGLRVASEPGWDLIVLDIMLPRVDGFDVCAALRKAGVRTPIIMLTARGQEAEKEVGLDSGADDYVTKPFSMRELRARIRVQLRRSAPATTPVHRFGSCEVDFNRAEVRRDGVPVDITAQELRLLGVMLQHPGRVLTRDQLISEAWGHGTAITDRAVDTHLFNLRRKLEPDPASPRFFVSIRGIGYRFDAEP